LFTHTALLAVVARPVATGGIRGQCSFKLFCVPTNFVMPRTFFIETYNKNKNIAPLKCIFPPQTLKPGYGPGRWSGFSFICFYDTSENVNMMSFEVAFQIERFWCQFDSANISILFNVTDKSNFDFLKMAENAWFLTFWTLNMQWWMAK